MVVSQSNCAVVDEDGDEKLVNSDSSISGVKVTCTIAG